VGWKPGRGAIRCGALSGRRPTQLFVRGERQNRARYPNRAHGDAHGGAWAHVAAVDSPDEYLGFHHGRAERHHWEHPEDGSVAVFSGFDWAFRILPLAGYDAQTHRIALGAKTWCALRAGDRYLVEGLLEDLDAEGEWCVDPRADALYWWPPVGVDPESAVMSGAGPVVTMTGVSDVVLSDVTLGGCDGDGVRIQDSRSCAVERCLVRCCAKTGIVIAGGSDDAVRACEVSVCGEGGISAQGGDRKVVTGGGAGFTSPGRHRIADNDVHDCAQVWRTYRPGIATTGVGNTIAHNRVHHLPHAGITFAGNEHVIELNEVDHVNRESADTGGLYFCSRDWTQRGTIIRWNSFHHCGGYGKADRWKPVTAGAVEYRYPEFTWGVYLDDPSSGTRVLGNVFDRVPMCAMHNHGGSDNLWANNLIIDCPAISIGALAHDWDQWPSVIEAFRSMTSGSPDLLEFYPELSRIDRARPERVSGVRFERNIIIVTAAGSAWLRAQHPEWGSGVPIYQLRLDAQDIAANRWDSNCISYDAGISPLIQSTLLVDGKPQPTVFLSWSQWRALGQDAHSALADPGFADRAHGDWSLRPDSAAVALGFEPIPLDQIGPRAHPGWRSGESEDQAIVERFALDPP
ncbi:MAG: right-handed parallel beta-helix repeat-containing protein, partial [Planctomycetes bacterium]|nr:right-handed parallel beta-helix repeat-containing protein [Planctomycetota bacterium]